MQRTLNFPMTRICLSLSSTPAVTSEPWICRGTSPAVHQQQGPADAGGAPAQNDRTSVRRLRLDVQLVDRQALGRRHPRVVDLEDVEALLDVAGVDVAVVPVRRPRAAQDEPLLGERAPVEVRN